MGKNEYEDGQTASYNHRDLIKEILLLPESDEHRIFLIACAVFGDKDGTNVWPGRPKLAKYSRKSLSTISRYFEKFVGKYLIKDGKRGYLDQYKIQVPGYTPMYTEEKITSISQAQMQAVNLAAEQAKQALIEEQKQAIARQQTVSTAVAVNGYASMPAVVYDTPATPHEYSPAREYSPAPPAPEYATATVTNYHPDDLRMRHLVRQRITLERRVALPLVLSAIDKAGIDRKYFRWFCGIDLLSWGISKQDVHTICTIPIEQWGFTFRGWKWYADPPAVEPLPREEPEPATVVESEPAQKYPF